MTETKILSCLWVVRSWVSELLPFYLFFSTNYVWNEASINKNALSHLWKLIFCDITFHLSYFTGKFFTVVLITHVPQEGMFGTPSTLSYVQSNSVCGHNSSHSREVFTELSTWVNPYGWWLHNSIYSIHYFFIICALVLFLCSTPVHTLYRFSFQFLKEFRISLPYLLASAHLLSIEKMEAQEILVNGCPENSGF